MYFAEGETWGNTSPVDYQLISWDKESPSYHVDGSMMDDPGSS
jgi:hypothetical protein